MYEILVEYSNVILFTSVSMLILLGLIFLTNLILSINVIKRGYIGSKKKLIIITGGFFILAYLINFFAIFVILLLVEYAQFELFQSIAFGAWTLLSMITALMTRKALSLPEEDENEELIPIDEIVYSDKPTR